MIIRVVRERMRATPCRHRAAFRGIRDQCPDLFDAFINRMEPAAVCAIGRKPFDSRHVRSDVGPAAAKHLPHPVRRRRILRFLLHEGVRPERNGCTGDDFGEIGTVHRFPGNWQLALHPSPSWPANLQGKFLRHGAQEWPAIWIWPRTHETHVAPIRVPRSGRRDVAVGVDGLREEAHDRDAVRAIRVSLPRIGDVECSALACELDHPFLRCDIDVPHRRGPLAKESLQPLSAKATGITSAEDEVGAEGLDPSFEKRGRQPPEPAMPSQHVEHPALDTEPYGRARVGDFIVVRRTGAEDGESLERDLSWGGHCG